MKTLTLSLTLIAVSCLPLIAQTSDPWQTADEIVASMSKTSFPELNVSISDFGAVANNPEQLSTEAINLAILSVNQRGGGTVTIPDSTYYTGPITLKSNVRLNLMDGAVLKFSTDINQYFPPVLTRWEGIDCYNTHPLIYAYGETNIALTGKGKIDAQGSKDAWWNMQNEIERNEHPLNPSDPASPQLVASRLRLLEMGEQCLPVNQRIFSGQTAMRPQFVNFYRCTTVLIEDVTLLNSPFWVIHPLFCNDLIVRGVTVINHGPNGDGCDPESCKNVLIENCVFNTGDDCIAIKSGRNEDGRKWGIPSENIVIRGCKMVDGHGGVVIGSEISGGYKNLYVEDCEMNSPNLDRVIRIKTSPARGGVIENIYVRNVKVGECRESVLRINLDYEPKEKAKRGFIPEVRNVYLENVTCGKSQYGMWFCGLDDVTNINNINLSNCSFDGVISSELNYAKGKVGEVNLDNVYINGKQIKKIK